MVIVKDVETEKVVDFTHDGLAARVVTLKDVSIYDVKSYYDAKRAKATELQTDAAMAQIEPEMGRSVENFMMAEAISSGKAPSMPLFPITPKRPNGGTNRQKWYKQMRIDANKSFWLDHDRVGRDRLREAARQTTSAMQEYMEMIVSEDRTRSHDPFYRHHRDAAAAAADKPAIYERIAKDIYIVLDREANVVLCSVSQLFQHFFGAPMFDKVVDATKQWAGFPLLPQPHTQRHMADALMRQQHPELDMELATTPQELQERAMCMVHYGTWAEEGRTHPQYVTLTPDTNLLMGATERRSRVNQPEKVFPHFKVGVLGLCSEVCRFLMRTLAPKEYQDCLEAFRGLPKPKRMAVSHPDWATLFVLGINSFTQRHRDENDIKHGLSSLVPMGSYTGKLQS